MIALVTGASGFIGKKLSEKLLAQNFDVIGLSRREVNIKNSRFRSLSIDLTDKKAVMKLPKNIDVVFHTAAFIPKDDSERYFEDCLNNNVVATENIAKFAKKSIAKKFIFSSSIAVYGLITLGRINESYLPYPSSFYGLSKKLAEERLVFYLKDKIPYVILRYSSVFGVGMKNATVLIKFIEDIKKGKDIIIYGTGKRTQDFVYIDDVVDANISAFAKRAEGIYLIGSGRQTSLLSLAKAVKSVYPLSKSKIIFDKSKPEDPQRVCLDYTKANKAFVYKPKYSLKEGLRKII